MAAIRSSLRSVRKPSSPSSEAIACRSARGLSSSCLRWSTDTAAHPSVRSALVAPRTASRRLLDRIQDQLHEAGEGGVDALVVDHLHPGETRPLGEVTLKRPDVRERGEVSLGRTGPRPVGEVATVKLLVAHDEKRLSKHATLAERRLHGSRHDVYALDHYGFALVRRPFDDGGDPGGHASGLIAVAVEPPGLERRVMHTGHGLMGEEGPQNLTDHVRCDHPPNSQPGGEHRGEGGLPYAGGAADQDHERPIQPVEAAPTLVAADRALPLLGAQHLEAELVEPVDPDLAVPTQRQSSLDLTGELEGALRREAARLERLRHQSLRVGQAVSLVDDDGLSRPHRGTA